MKVRKSFVALLLVFGCIEPGFGQSPSDGQPYDFKGIRLGMTVSEFLAAPVPDAREYKDTDCPNSGGCKPFPECFPTRMDGTPKNDLEAALGMVTCQWVTKPSNPFDVARATHAPQFVAEAADYELWFIRAPGDSEARLFLMQFSIHSASYGRAVAALSERFGKPSRVRQEPVRNRLGVVYLNESADWRNKTSLINATKFVDSLDKMTVAYVFRGHMQYYQRKLQEGDRRKGPPL